jgi:hypothetical protein
MKVRTANKQRYVGKAQVTLSFSFAKEFVRVQGIFEAKI